MQKHKRTGAELCSVSALAEISDPIAKTQKKCKKDKKKYKKRKRNKVSPLSFTKRLYIEINAELLIKNERKKYIIMI
jgi:hypothetical protein